MPSSRRGGRTVPIDLGRRLSGYSTESLLVLATAAGASPSAAHRWPSVAHLISRALALAPASGREADSGRLPGLLAACRREDPSLEDTEDFVPNDPRLKVLARRGDDLHRLFPGSVERAIADVERAEMLALAVDGVLVPDIGFGVADYFDVGLQYVDHAVQMLSSAWPDGDRPNLNEPPFVSPAECDAARSLLTQPIPASVEATPGRRAALAWASAEPGQLPYRPGDPQSLFGRFLSVRMLVEAFPRSSPLAGDETTARWWLPPAYIPDALGYGANQLARRAAHNTRARQQFSMFAAARARRALWRFGPVFGPLDLPEGPATSPGDVVQWVVSFGEGRVLLVQLVAQLDVRELALHGDPVAVRIARRAASQASPQIEVPLPGGTLILEAETEVLPLLVFAAPAHTVSLPVRGAANMSLEDLAWIAQSAKSDSDLFMFCRELANPNRPEIFSMDVIDLWESWRTGGKVFFRGGRPPDAMTFEPHWGSGEEWTRSARLAPLERALATLGLAPLSGFDGVDEHNGGPAGVYAWAPQQDADNNDPSPSRPDMIGWRVHAGSPPVAVSAADPGWPPRDEQILHDLAGSFAYGFQQIESTWRQAHAHSELTGYVIRLLPCRTPSQPTTEITVDHVDTIARGAELIVEIDLSVDADALVENINANIDVGRDLMADVVSTAVAAAGLHPESTRTIVEAWKSAPPTLAVELTRATTTRADLPDPWPLDEAMISQADRDVAQRIQAEGVAVGIYSGEAAKLLDRDSLAPTALALLIERLAQHPVQDILLVGMQQLERTIAAKERNARNIQQALRMKTVGWDPIDRLRHNEHEHLVLRRTAEIVIEAALREEPHGNRPVDRLAWMELLAAAHAYLEATSRSEAVYHQVRPIALEITEFYEIRTAAARSETPVAAAAGTGRVYDLDLECYQLARAEHKATFGEEDAAGGDAHGNLAAGSDADAAPSGRRIVDSAVDSAMRAAYGVSGTDLVTVLLALAYWPLPCDGPDIAISSLESVVALALENTVFGEQEDGPEIVRAAIAMLCSTPAELRSADWRPWHARGRQCRLLTRPLAVLRDDFVVLAPHLCAVTLSIYIDNLRHGLLPWSSPEPPRALGKALEAVRARRNRALEDEVVAALREGGYVVRERIKKNDHARLEVPALTGEIDAVAAFPGSPVLWLLEVKDVTDTYVVPEIRRHLDKFYGSGSSKPSYLDQLTAKLTDLAPYADQVAHALGLEPLPAGISYVVKAYFVTRQPVPAAFVKCEIPFVTLPRLLQELGGSGVSQA